FHLRAPLPKPPPPPPPPGEATLELSHRIAKLSASFEVALRGTRTPLPSARVVAELPSFLAYEPGSAAVDGAAIADPEVLGTKATFNLGSLGADWTRKLSFRARATSDAVTPGAAATASLADEKGATLVSARNSLQLGKDLVRRPVTL